MTAKTVTCTAIACDICDTEYDLEGEGYTQHFDSLPGAVKYLADDEWKVQPDGYAVCPASDEEHDAARAALEPKPPAPQIEGQTVIALVPGGQDTAAETRTCTGCDGTGERRDFNADGEFESVERCGGCDGTGRVAIEDAAESGAER